MAKESFVNNLFETDILNRFALYTIVLFAIIFNRDTLITTVSLSFYTSTIILFSIVIISFFVVFITNRNRLIVNRDSLFYVGIYAILVCATTLIKMDFQLYHLSIIFYMLITLLFVHIMSFNYFFSILSDIMFYLGLYSLLTNYIIKPLIFNSGEVLNKIPVAINSSGLRFLNFGLSYVVYNKNYIRNFGIFREPGVYQFFLLIPFIYEMLFKKQMRWHVSLVLGITVLSTFSPPGILALFIIMILRLCMSFVAEKPRKRVVLFYVGGIILSTLIVLYFYLSFSLFNTMVNEMVKKVFTANMSSSMRLDSIKKEITLFFKHPIWGNKFSSVTTHDDYSINSTFSLFAIYGVIIGLYQLYIYYKLSKTLMYGPVFRISFFFLVLLMINTQFLIGNPFYWLFGFSFLFYQDNIYANIHTIRICR